MKKIGYIFLTLLEIALLVGAYVLNYFTKKKMGMMRFVAFKNGKWESAFPLQLWKNISLIVLVVLALLVVIAVVKKWAKLSKIVKLMSVFMIILTAFSLYFTMCNTTEIIRAYYFMSPLIALAALLQIIKTGVGVLGAGR